MGEGAFVSGSAMQGLWESYELSSYVIARRHRACVTEKQIHRGVC